MVSVTTENGLVAVVTGASRGLGAGMAQAFATHGLRLGLCARTQPHVPDGVEAVSAQVDVTEADAVDAFADSVVEHFGHIDLWVNNAGILDPIGPLVDADPGALRHHMDVNVMGVLFGSRSFARHVRGRTGGGMLVNLSSGAAATPYEGWAAYCASKAAVDMITEVIHLEEREHGLRAVALAPGVVDTDMQAKLRSTPATLFPSVGKFLQLHEDRAFNSPAWVANYILDLVGANDDAVGTVRTRVPDQPIEVDRASSNHPQ